MINNKKMLRFHRLLTGFYDLKIRSKLFLVTISIIISLIISILLFTYYSKKSIILEEVRQRALDITTLVAFNSVQAIMNDNYLELQGLIDGIGNRRGVSEIMLLDVDGKVLVHNFTAKRGKKLDDPLMNKVLASQEILVLTDKSLVLDVSVPVFILSEKKAIARLLFLLDDTYSAIYKTLFHIGIIGISGIIVSIFISFFISRVITGPIQALVSATLNVARGQRNIQIEPKSKDEIGQLTLAFNKMVQDISSLEIGIRQSEQLAAIGLAAASLAHKIKTPLTSMKTFIEMFPERYQEVKFREAFQYHVLLQIGHLDKIMNELSRFSKERVPMLAMVDINHILTDIVNILKERIREHSIQIKMDQIQVPLILADKEQLGEAFLIIGENALEAITETGKLNIATSLLNVENSEKELQRRIRIIIQDTGIGIPAANLQKIFEPFVSSKPKGMGLGLTICNNIIKKHRGTIQVTSEINKGTTFEINLPVND